MRGRMATCTGCGRLFVSVTSFDRHHTPKDRPPYVDCIDPESAGLVVRKVVDDREVWGSPTRDVPVEGLGADLEAA